MTKKVISILGWLISAATLALLFSKLDLHTLLDRLSSAKWELLALAAIVNFIVVALKSLRWQWLMRPVESVSYANVLKATLIGLAGNNVFPARGGDWLKIYLMGRREKVSKTMLTSITGLDKIFDGVSILLLFGIMSFHSNFPVWVKSGMIAVSIALFVLFMISLSVLLHFKKTNADENLRGFSKFIAKLGRGMQALGSFRIAASTFVISLVSSFLQILTLVLCELAFGLHVPLGVTAAVFVAINLAIMVPSAPSGVGPFEAAAVLAFMWMGVSRETGFNVALMYHAVQFVPVTLAGVAIWKRYVGHTKEVLPSPRPSPSGRGIGIG